MRKFQLLESSKEINITFLLSQGLINILNTIISNYENGIALDILKCHKNINSTISYIDRTRNIDMVSYTRSIKIIDKIVDEKIPQDSPDIWRIRQGWLENRETIKIGRFIYKMFPNRYSPQEIEIFVNIFKAESKKDISGLKWERVYGDDFNKWYLYSNYVAGGGTLNRSCLRKSSKNGYVNFLSGNPNSCRLLILKNDKNKLLGRSILWRLKNTDDRVFMDRIYTRFDEDVNLFIDTAKKQGWYYKLEQTYGNTPIVDGKTGEIGNVKMVINDFKKRNFKGWPYMDTFQYYNSKTKILTNDVSTFDSIDVLKLDQINGNGTQYNKNIEMFDLDDDMG